MRKIALIVFCCFTMSCFGQAITTKIAATGNVNNTSSGYTISNGNVRVFTRYTNSLSGDMPKTVYEVDMETGGDYYLLASTLSTYSRSGGFQRIEVFVNGEDCGYLNSTKGEWEIIGIYQRPCVTLRKGKNVIEFVSRDPLYPEIDAVQLSKRPEYMVKENTVYNEYKRSMAKKGDSRKSALTQNTSSWTVTPVNMGIDGNSDATAWKNVPVVFTYHRKIPVTEKTKFKFHTTPTGDDDYNDVDTYMHLYKVDDPYHYSWYDDNSGYGHHAQIEQTLSPGDYYLVIRAKSNFNANNSIPRDGLVNVYCNDELLNTNMAVSGYMIDAPVKQTGTFNYFTSKTDASPRLFLLDGNKIRFNTEPDTYYAPANYHWQNGARIKVNQTSKNNNWKILVTATGAWSMCFGNCDVYAGIQDAPDKYLTRFKSLQSGDAMLMANDNASYNSAAWAGGITNKNIWIGDTSMGLPYSWGTWDDYFGNNPVRYQGAATYKTNGNGEESVIVYSRNWTPSSITHFAVTNHANNKLHGFAYESKIGDWGRITHEKISLNTSEYGSPYLTYYADGSTPYTLQSKSQIYTLEESVNDGLTTIRDIQLEGVQESYIRDIRDSSEQIGQLFSKWTSRVNTDRDEVLASNEIYFSSDEAQELIGYGKSHIEESLVFFSNLIFLEKEDPVIDKELLSIMFCMIAADQYGKLMDEIKSSWAESPYTDDGSYICPSCEYFTKLYIKRILGNREGAIGSTSAKTYPENNDGLFCLSRAVIEGDGTDIILNLPNDANVSLQVVGVSNSQRRDIVSSRNLSAGKHVFHIGAGELSNGISICTLKVGEQTFSRKLIKK